MHSHRIHTIPQQYYRLEETIEDNNPQLAAHGLRNSRHTQSRSLVGVLSHLTQEDLYHSPIKQNKLNTIQGLIDLWVFQPYHIWGIKSIMFFFFLEILVCFLTVSPNNFFFIQIHPFPAQISRFNLSLWVLLPRLTSTCVGYFEWVSAPLIGVKKKYYPTWGCESLFEYVQIIIGSLALD